MVGSSPLLEKTQGEGEYRLRGAETRIRDRLPLSLSDWATVPNHISFFFFLEKGVNFPFYPSLRVGKVILELLKNLVFYILSFLKKFHP